MGVAAGGALIVLGAVVWFSAPDSEHRIVLRPTVAPHAGGFALSGSF